VSLRTSLIEDGRAGTRPATFTSCHIIASGCRQPIDCIQTKYGIHGPSNTAEWTPDHVMVKYLQAYRHSATLLIDVLLPLA
jgi:hypothetical protein